MQCVKRCPSGSPSHNGITNRLPLPTLLHQMAAAWLSPGPALPLPQEGARVLPLSTADTGRTSVDLGKARVSEGCLRILSKGKKPCAPDYQKFGKNGRDSSPILKSYCISPAFIDLDNLPREQESCFPGRLNPFSPGLKRLLGRKSCWATAHLLSQPPGHPKALSSFKQNEKWPKGDPIPIPTLTLLQSQ